MRYGSIVLIGAVALGACAAEEQIAFRSDKERACHAQANAEIAGSNTKELVRAQQTGGFVVVTKVDGFVRDIAPSPTFEACMASAEAGLAPQVSEGAPVQFSGDEQVIWNSLSDAAKRDALLFIQQGGTLTQFVSQG